MARLPFAFVGAASVAAVALALVQVQLVDIAAAPAVPVVQSDTDHSGH